MGNKSEYQEFQAKLKELINSGLRHGFFTVHVSGELKNQKNQVVIEAGKKHKYTFTKEDFE